MIYIAWVCAYVRADYLRSLVWHCEVCRWVVANNEFKKENDLYVWNAMWLAFVTMTTVGYGLFLLGP